ncbi:MAG: NAD-dependent epimerase/dehydratase family protein [Patescibacteria group bacterium]
MHILVTGGAGFIGSHVVDSYIAAGHQVSVIDNLSTGQQEFLNSAAEFHQADITHKEHLQELIRTINPDVINHHAAHIQVGNSVKYPQYDAEHNILGLLNVMEVAKDLPIKKIIFASTGGAMYGNQPTPFDESMVAKPLSPYGISKRAGELYLHYYLEQYGIPYVVLRYANVYGPRQNPHGESGVVAIFSELIQMGKKPIINGDGTNTRDYVYIDDVAQANMAALEYPESGIFNIGTGVESSTNEIYEKVVAAFGIELHAEHGPARPGEQKTSSLSAALAQEKLGWQPSVGIDEGIQRVVEWYTNN